MKRDRALASPTIDCVRHCHSLPTWALTGADQMSVMAMAMTSARRAPRQVNHAVLSVTILVLAIHQIFLCLFSWPWPPLKARHPGR